MPKIYRESAIEGPQNRPEPSSGVAVGLSLADESARVSEAATMLSGLGPHATIDDYLGVLDTALHRIAALGMVTSQHAVNQAQDVETRNAGFLRIEARIMRVENQLRRKQTSDRRDLLIVILLVLLAFSMGANLF